MRSSFGKFGILMLTAILLANIFSSCNDKEEEITTKYFLESSDIKSLTSSDLSTMFQSTSGISALSMSDVNIYKIVYKTKYLGDSIEASGVVCVPVTEDEVPVMSYQHGTIVAKSEAPSKSSFSNASDVSTAMALLSGTGFVVGLPDYIGFGSSSSKFHPFMHKASTANVVADFVHAMIEFVKKEKKATISDKLFLAGYSQGGYATLAAMEELEKRNETGYFPTATSCGGSPVDLNEVLEHIMELSVYDQPYFVPYVLKSYQSVEEVDPSFDLSTVFNTPYDTKINSLFNGSNTGSQITAQLTEVISDLFTEAYINSYDTDEDYSEVNIALENNSITPWVLKSKLRLYHGSNDDLIPSNQSVQLMNDLVSNGSAGKVSYKALEGDHTGAAIPWAVETIIWFNMLK